MNVLVVGGGGREHAICHKLSQSGRADKIYCVPGNAGISEIAEIADIPVMNFKDIIKFAKEKNRYYRSGTRRIARRLFPDFTGAGRGDRLH